MEEQLPDNLQQLVLDEKYNPHQAIIARHAARKAERERAEKLEQERLELEQKEREAKLERKRTLKQKEEDVQLRHTKLMEEKPLEPKEGILLRYEGQLKGWKERYFFIEDKLPLCLKCFKQKPANPREADLECESYELTSETTFEDASGNHGSSGSNGSIPGGGSSASLTSLPNLASSPEKKLEEKDKSSIKKSLIAPKTRPNAFKMSFVEKSIRVAAENHDAKQEWLDSMHKLIQKHHGLALSLLPPPPELPVPNGLPITSSPSKVARSPSSDSIPKFELPLPIKRKKSSYSISEDAELMNPLEEEIVGMSFKNELFGD